MFYAFQPYLHAERGITGDPDLPGDAGFMTGEPVSVPLPEPLVFEADFTRRAQPGHLLGDAIPVVSSLLWETLHASAKSWFAAARPAAGTSRSSRCP